MTALLCAASPFAFDGELPGVWMPREDGWQFDGTVAVHGDKFFRGGVLGLPGKEMDDVELATDVKLSAVYHKPESVWAGLLIRSRKPLECGPWNGGVLLFLRANGELVLQRTADATLDSKMTVVRPREVFARLKIEAEGARIRGYLNDELVLEADDDTFSSGEVALVHYGNETTFRNVQLEGNLVQAKTVDAVTSQQPVPEPQEPVTPLPAIGIRKNTAGIVEFYNRDSGKRFVPKGFNHTVLSNTTTGWHATFNVGIYNPDEMEALLVKMAAVDANTIRVWIWGVQDKTGFTGAPESCGLSNAYMKNVVDFLQRCTQHGIYVIPILDEIPHNAYYDNIATQTDVTLPTPQITGYNRNYFSPGKLAAKAQAVEDFIQYVKDADAGLLHTVLGWAFSNEAFVNHSEGPFNQDSGGVVVANGKQYDMGDKEQRQACYDESIVYWCNTLTDAVKSVAPDALTTLGLWTSDAHDRDPINYLIPDDRDPRRPPRPSVLAGKKSNLDFLDIHIYPWDGTSKVRPAAHEWDAVKNSGKPAIVGEYGIFKNKTSEEAKTMMGEMLEQAYNMGYQGSLHWVWDLTAVEGQTWSSVEAGLATYLMQLDVHPE